MPHATLISILHIISLSCDETFKVLIIRLPIFPNAQIEIPSKSHDVGSGDQSTSLGGGIESPNMHLTPWEPH